MESRIGVIGSRGLLSYMFMAASLSNFIDDSAYKTNRKPNPNAHRIKFNRCPRKLKKAIKNSFKDDTDSYFIKNLLNSSKIKVNLKEIIQDINFKHSGEFTLTKGRIRF